uniref:Protein SPT2 homolog n=1 Tax=Rhabditophanes sp. KR3021 TaxID=114890 RepID=A0AC35U766_9BILA
MDDIFSDILTGAKHGPAKNGNNKRSNCVDMTSQPIKNSKRAAEEAEIAEYQQELKERSLRFSKVDAKAKQHTLDKRIRQEIQKNNGKVTAKLAKDFNMDILTMQERYGSDYDSLRRLHGERERESIDNEFQKDKFLAGIEKQRLLREKLSKQKKLTVSERAPKKAINFNEMRADLKSREEKTKFEGRVIAQKKSTGPKPSYLDLLKQGVSNSKAIKNGGTAIPIVEKKEIVPTLKSSSSKLLSKIEMPLQLITPTSAYTIQPKVESKPDKKGYFERDEHSKSVSGTSKPLPQKVWNSKPSNNEYIDKGHASNVRDTLVNSKTTYNKPLGKRAEEASYDSKRKDFASYNSKKKEESLFDSRRKEESSYDSRRKEESSHDSRRKEESSSDSRRKEESSYDSRRKKEPLYDSKRKEEILTNSMRKQESSYDSRRKQESSYDSKRKEVISNNYKRKEDSKGKVEYRSQSSSSKDYKKPANPYEKPNIRRQQMEMAKKLEASSALKRGSSSSSGQKFVPKPNQPTKVEIERKLRDEESEKALQALRASRNNFIQSNNQDKGKKRASGNRDYPPKKIRNNDDYYANSKNIESDYDSEDSLDDFIVDDEDDHIDKREIEEAIRGVSKNFDKKRWRENERNISDRNMEASYHEIDREERRSYRIGYLEDLREAQNGSEAL